MTTKTITSTKDHMELSILIGDLLINGPVKVTVEQDGEEEETEDSSDGR